MTLAEPDRQPLAGDYLRLQKTQPLRAVSVCHIASGDAWGGAETQIATLLKSLAQRNDMRVCAIVLNDLRLAQELREAGIEIKVVPETTKSFPAIVRESALFLRGRRTQIIHSHRYKENLLAMLLGYRYPVRLVRTQHGQPEPYTGFSGLKQRFVYAIDRQIARYAADRVISVSSDLTRYLQSHVANSKIAVVHNGISLDLVRSSFSKAEAKQSLFIRTDAPVVGIATRLTAIKRLDLFVASAICVVKAIPTARFVVAGSGAQESILRELIRQADLEHQILLLGHRADIHDVMQAMDLMLLTSDHEGLPMAMLEAMALGVPIVSRKVGGIPEVIQDGVNGRLVDTDSPDELANVCTSLLLDEKLRAQLGANARRVVEENYSAERNAAEVVRLYRALGPFRE